MFPSKRKKEFYCVRRVVLGPGHRVVIRYAHAAGMHPRASAWQYATHEPAHWLAGHLFSTSSVRPFIVELD